MELGKIYTYDDYVNDVESISSKHKGIIQKYIYGKSYDNRRLYSIIIGKGDCKVVCTAGVHGRESINTPVMMKIIETYALLYESNSEYFCKVKDILDSISICFLPLVNPDGYEIARMGFDVINDYNMRLSCMNKSSKHEEWKNNAHNIDINRNFNSVTWREKFPGDIYFSEKETVLVKHVLDRYKAPIFLDFHSRGESIYYYRNAMNDEYNIKQHKIANIISKISGFSLNSPEEEISDNDSGGSTVHYYSEKIGGNAFTIETVPEEENFPLNPYYQIQTFEKISKIPIILAEYTTFL